MNALTREVLVRKPNVFLRNFVIGMIASIVTSIVMNIGIRVGYDQGIQDARAGVELAAVETDGCTIQDPLACVVKITESALDLFRPTPEFTVTVTGGAAVICAEAERAYWACADDLACPIETFEKIADDVNFCQNPPRR